MKTKFFNGCISYLPTAIAIVSFVLFTSIKATDGRDDAAPSAKECCVGYSIPINKLKQFMLDSLHKIKFQGGVYSKKDLLNSIKALPDNDDSVFLLTVLENFQSDNQPNTDLAITSPSAPDVIFLTRPCYCHPIKPCCKRKIRIATVNWNCISYIQYGDTTAGNPENFLSSFQ
jgi:hypothetical protein